MSVVALSADQLRRLRADLGDPEGKAFSDAEIHDLLNDPSVVGDHDRAVELGLWRLITNSQLFDRYAGGMTPEERIAVRDGLRATYRLWRQSHNATGDVPRVGQGRMRVANRSTGDEF